MFMAKKILGTGRTVLTQKKRSQYKKFTTGKNLNKWLKRIFCIAVISFTVIQTSQSTLHAEFNIHANKENTGKIKMTLSINNAVKDNALEWREAPYSELGYQQKARKDLIQLEFEIDYLKQDDAWKIRLINSENPLPQDYTFESVVISNTWRVDERIYDELKAMLKDGRKAGCSLLICSGYRSFERQTELYLQDVKKYMRQGMTYEEACAETEKTLLKPGESEHESGLAVDIVSVRHQVLDKNFEKTKEAKWLAEHAHEYGFILRYPKDKEEITGIDYEPWHFRYVGVEAATEIWENNLCLEEYLNLKEIKNYQGLTER